MLGETEGNPGLRRWEKNRCCVVHTALRKSRNDGLQSNSNAWSFINPQKSGNLDLQSRLNEKRDNKLCPSAYTS